VPHPTRIFNTPEELLEAWKGYKENLTEQNKEWLQIQYVGRNGERKADPMKVPMTLEGFKRYCRENHGEVHNYFVNSDELYNDFNTICRAIREEIRECQIVGGLLGVYNPSITQRLNGLTEKQDISLKAPVSPFTSFDLDVSEDNGSS
tara:strand:- start:4329 stop:4772 length:444 start_codon:yes stop_codon:yes gene_type:complete